MDSNKNENSVSKVSAIKKEINWISLTKFDLTRQKSKNYIKHIGIEKTNYATSGKIQKDSKTFQKILKDSKRFQNIPKDSKKILEVSKIFWKILKWMIFIKSILRRTEMESSLSLEP